LDKIWSFTSEKNGIILVETPAGFYREIKSMAYFFRKYDIQVSLDEKADHIKLVKTPDSPGKLPF
jgi:hypothetical protein